MCDWTDLGLDGNSPGIFAIKRVTNRGVPEGWFDCAKAVPFRRHSCAATDIRTDAKGRTSAAYHSSLSSRTASARTSIVPSVFAVPENIIIGFNDFAAGRNVCPDKGNKSHSEHNIYKQRLLAWNGIYNVDKADVGYAILHQNTLLYADHYPKKRWEGLIDVIANPPASFVWILFPNAVTLFGEDNSLLKHFVNDVVVSDSD